MKQKTLYFFMLLMGMKLLQAQNNGYGCPEDSLILKSKIAEYPIDAGSKQKSTVYHWGGFGNDIKYVCFKADFDLDMDGSPKAYHPKGIGIDYNGNAQNGQGQFSPSVLHFQKGVPFIQIKDMPNPGYYVSMTSLKIQGVAAENPNHYVNSENINYIALPSNYAKWGIELGDIALVINLKTQHWAYAIFADASGKNIGEGSLSLAQSLHISLCQKTNNKIVGGMDTTEIVYVVFKKSGLGANNYSSLTQNMINDLGKKACSVKSDNEVYDKTPDIIEAVTYLLFCNEHLLQNLQQVTTSGLQDLKQCSK